MENKRYVQEESQGIDQLRQLEFSLFNNIKVASIGKIIGFYEKGYIVELIPKLDNKATSIQTLNYIYEKEYLVHDKYKDGNEGDKYLIKKSIYRKIEGEEALGKFIVVLFLDNYVSQLDNENLNVDNTKTKHSLVNGYALQFIINGKENK